METMKLTKKDIKEWTKALRSREYTQGRGFLCQTLATDPKKLKFCCLGVACDLFLDDFWEKSKHCDFWSIDGCDDMPPESLRSAIDKALNKSAVFKKYISPEPTGACNKLSYCNDARGFNFEEIATIIEQAAGIKNINPPY